MKNRFALLDVWGGTSNENKSVDTFRKGIGSNCLAFGAAYYPWLKTSIVSTSDISWRHIHEWDTWLQVASGGLDTKNNTENKLKELITKYFKDKNKQAEDKEALNRLKDSLHSALLQNWYSYRILLETIGNQINLLPPSAAIAGTYTTVDNTRGVWKAPANISINNVISPSTNITHEEQEELNVPMNGKAINAIRDFTGDGIKIWGARTLDGNSQDWRYVNVRRTMIFLEESVKNATRAYVFESNDANTWINMKNMIENFLRGIWRRGGLAGASPEDAYNVHVGLGDTMTPEDLLEGILRITVLVAISRPAEFIEITFQQQMQES